MGQTFIVTKWLDNCLVAFPQEEWERMDASGVKRACQAAAGKALSDAYACRGRADLTRPHPLSPSLRAHAGLTRDVTIMGVGRCEIWDTAAWHKAEQDLTAPM